MRDSEGGPCLFGILHVRVLSRAKSKPFLSLGRAIIVRNGEIIPMSREFTPETERQRLQLLVSKNQTHLLPFLVESCASLYCQVARTLPPPPYRQTAPYWSLLGRPLHRLGNTGLGWRGGHNRKECGLPQSSHCGPH